MDNHHVNYDPSLGMGMDGQNYRQQMGGQPQQQQNQQSQFNDFVLDPSLVADSHQWQPQQPHQPVGQYNHVNHQDVFNPPQQHQQPYGQYGQPPQSQQFNYGIQRQQPQQQPSYPTQYSSIYGQAAHSSSPNPADAYNNAFCGVPSNSQSMINGSQVQSQSRGFQNFERDAGAFSYPSASRGPAPATIAPHELNRDSPYPTQSRNTPTQQTVQNNNANELYTQSWNAQSAGNVVNEAARPQTVLAAAPATANQDAGRRSAAAASTPAATKPPSPRQQQQSTYSTMQPKTGGLRITHPELLDEVRNDPSPRFANAPFLVIESRRVELPDKLATKSLPSWQVKSNRSGIQLVEGLHERLSASRRIHKIHKDKSLSRAKRSQGGVTKTARLKSEVAASTGSATNSPRASVASDTESSEYTNSEDDSDYSSDEDDDDMVYDLRTLEEIRPEPRPTNIADAAAWDAFTIIYCPAGRRPTPDEKRKAGQEFPALIIALREDLLKVTTKLADSKNAPKAKELKAQQKLREQAITKALRVATESQHEEKRDVLFTNDRFIVVLTNILRHCNTTKDYLGELPYATFELMSTFNFQGTSAETLKRAKFDSIVKRFITRIDEIKTTDEEIKTKKQNVKRFIDTIQGANTPTPLAGAFTKTARPLAKPEEASKENSPSKNAKTTTPSSASTPYTGTASLKRAREPDTTSTQSNKRVAADDKKPAPPKPAPAPSKAAANFFSKLGKQPAKPAVPPPAFRPVAKKPAPAPPASKPSVLGALLASINEKPKEVKKVEIVEKIKETPEEKKRRERKESRRHLRVKFRDENLAEIRLFTHDQAEDEGRDVDMLRDAHDDRSEGMMLKQKLAIEDEDEDEVKLNDMPYPDLIKLDLSDLGEELLNNIPTSRGGNKEFRTPEMDVQDKRAENELMVVYTDEADIPPTPKEPPPFEGEETPPRDIFTVANDPVLKARLHDIRLYGLDTAFGMMVSEVVASYKKKAEEDRLLRAGPESIPAILEVVKAENFEVKGVNRFWVPQNIDPEAMANLYKVFAKMKGLTYPRMEAPEWMTQEQIETYWPGKERKEAAENELRAQMVALAPPPQQQHASIQQLPFPIPGPPGLPLNMPTLPGFPAGMPPPDPAQLQQYLASMGYPNIPLPNLAGGGVPPMFPPMMGQAPMQQQPQHQWNAPASMPGQIPSQEELFAAMNPNSDRYYNANQGYDQGQQWNRSHSPQDGPGDKPYKNRGWNLEESDASKRWSNDGHKRGKKHGRGGDDHEDGGNTRRDPNYKRKTRPCSFFKEGKCTKGDQCGFIHDLNM